MATMNGEFRLVGEHEAAKLLGLGIYTLRRDRRIGGYGNPYIKIGRAVRYQPDELRAYVDDHVVTTQAEKQED